MPRIIPSNGSAGNLTLSGTLAKTAATCNGNSGTYTLSATNAGFSAGQVIFIWKCRGSTNIGEWEYNQIASYVAGTITTVFPLERTYTTSGSDVAQVLVSPDYATVNITATTSSEAWDGSIKGIHELRAQSITGSGDCDQRGLGYRGGSAVGGTSISGKQGEGTAGAGDTTSTAANGNGGGGGSANGSGTRASSGGGGGNKTSGGNGDNSSQPSIVAGVGGSAVGSDSDLTLIMGGGGGSGGSSIAPNAGNTGAGGRGGGCFIWIFDEISWTGRWLIDGNVGGNAARDGWGGGGGGGAGTGYFQGTKVTASGSHTGSGGAGGIEGGFPLALPGGAGSVGRFKGKTCSTPTLTTTPSALTTVGGHDFCQSFIHISGQ